MLLAANGGAAGVLLIFILVYLVFLVLMIAAWVKILTKAGYSGWWILIGVVPLVNVIMFFVFAFSEWPALQATTRYPPAPYQPSPNPTSSYQR